MTQENNQIDAEFQKRMDDCNSELEPLLAKYKLALSSKMNYTNVGIFGEVIFVDATKAQKQEENKEKVVTESDVIEV